MSAPVTADFLESLPKGTVIRVSARGHSFQLEAEAGAFRNFILQQGTPAYGFAGRRARYGGARLFWSADMLARWVADGLCTIEVVR
jgi:hypothetical protein